MLNKVKQRGRAVQRSLRISLPRFAAEGAALGFYSSEKAASGFSFYKLLKAVHNKTSYASFRQNFSVNTP
jgi:hypothetical protein